MGQAGKQTDGSTSLPPTLIVWAQKHGKYKENVLRSDFIIFLNIAKKFLISWPRNNLLKLKQNLEKGNSWEHSEKNVPESFLMTSRAINQNNKCIRKWLQTRINYRASWMASIHFNRISCVLEISTQMAGVSVYDFFNTSWIPNYTKITTKTNGIKLPYSIYLQKKEIKRKTQLLHRVRIKLHVILQNLSS